jgi:hypothetical protein
MFLSGTFRFYGFCTQKREPTSGLEPLTCSLRVIGRALQGFAQACKSRISKRVSYPCLAECCTVLRSRWYQSSINHVTDSIADVPALARENLYPTTLSRWPPSWRTCSRRPLTPNQDGPALAPLARDAPPLPSELASGYRHVPRRRISFGSCYSRRPTHVCLRLRPSKRVVEAAEKKRGRLPEPSEQAVS